MSRWPDLDDAASTMTLGLAAQTLDRLIGARDRTDRADVFAGVAGAFQRALVRLARDGAGAANTALARVGPVASRLINRPRFGVSR